MTDDQLFEDWANWITRTAEELTDIYLNRFVFVNIKRMFDTTPAFSCSYDSTRLTDSSLFVLGWLSRLYANRHADVRSTRA